MGHCNLEMSNECYGCCYYGTGDIDGCKLTIAFHKKHPNHTDEEYEKYMKAMTRKEERVLESIKYADAHPSDYANEMYDNGDIARAFEAGAEWADATTWKPSYGQINAIRLARAFVTDDFSDNPTLSEMLIELENQLKNLIK